MVGRFDKSQFFIEQLKIFERTRSGVTHTRASFNLLMLANSAVAVNPLRARLSLVLEAFNSGQSAVEVLSLSGQ